MSPKTFNTVDVVTAFGKFIFTMINTKMLSVPNINQTIISTPAVRADDSFKFYFASYNNL